MLKNLAAAAAFSILLAGCAVEGPAYQKMAVAPAKAAVYVYRTYPTMAYGAAVQLPVNCGDSSILLGPGGYHVFAVEPGEVLCSSHLENTANVQFRAEPGHEYYIRGWVSMGIVLARVNLEMVDTGTGTADRPLQAAMSRP